MIEVAEGRECKQTSLSQQSCTEVQHATTKTLQQQDENFENEKKTYTIKMNQNETGNPFRTCKNDQINFCYIRSPLNILKPQV